MRFVSILGDSISTYQGYNPDGYSVFYDEAMQWKNGLSGVNDTWWKKVTQALHASLCVNNSYSGSRVSGLGFPAANCAERLQNLRDKDCIPDIILVYIGFNDLGYGVPLFSASKEPGITDVHYFNDAYDTMLASIKRLYPKTRIVCGTLMKTRLADDDDWVFPEWFGGTWFSDYNNAIRELCQKHHCYLADLDKLGTTVETKDGSHPTKTGHQELADAWLHFIPETENNRFTRRSSLINMKKGRI